MKALLEQRQTIKSPPLKLIAILVVGFFMFQQATGGLCFAEEEPNWDKFSNEQIVEAIGKAENSIKYPYGVKSIDTKGDKEYARQICLNSVRNGRARWIKAEKPYDLIIYIGLRYCPPDAHKLNSNWVSNVKYFLLKNDLP